MEEIRRQEKEGKLIFSTYLELEAIYKILIVFLLLGAYIAICVILRSAGIRFLLLLAFFAFYFCFVGIINYILKNTVICLYENIIIISRSVFFESRSVYMRYDSLTDICTHTIFGVRSIKILFENGQSSHGGALRKVKLHHVATYWDMISKLRIELEQTKNNVDLWASALANVGGAKSSGKKISAEKSESTEK